ncbi:MAG TPA: S8 family serine peptidase [Fimbriimonadales bacterium]|nr:S8 family serine peptidase [Fimbriimonadales bacterium]
MKSKGITAPFLLLYLLFASVSLWAQEFVPGEVIVKFKPGAHFEAALANQQIGSRFIKEISGTDAVLLKLNPRMTVFEGLRYYENLPIVEYAEPNGIVKGNFAPNDPQWSKQWGPKKIECPAAWDIDIGDASVRISVVDTGVSKYHPDLDGKIVASWNTINNSSNSNDDNGHGSHVAGISAAETNNGVGIAGVSYNCSIVAVKSMGSDGTGTVADVSEGITWSWQNGGAHVINLSLGTFTPSSTLESAVNNAWNNNVIIAAAAGNHGTPVPFYPAFYDNCIAVAASDQSDNKASFSAFGTWVDVGAPGVDIFSCWAGSGYATADGTSMASPHVAGEAGLLWSYLGTSVSNSTIRSRIEQNCDPFGAWTVWGRINCFKALNTGEVINEFAPVSFGTVQGTKRAGNIGSLASDDENRLRISSNKPDFSAAKIEWWCDTFVSYPGGLTKLEIEIQSFVQPADTCDIYLLNINTGNLDYIGTVSFGTSDTTQVLAVTSGLSDYVVDGYCVAYFAVEGPSLLEMQTDKVTFRTFSQ